MLRVWYSTNYHSDKSATAEGRTTIDRPIGENSRVFHAITILATATVSLTSRSLPPPHNSCHSILCMPLSVISYINWSPGTYCIIPPPNKIKKAEHDTGTILRIKPPHLYNNNNKPLIMTLSGHKTQIKPSRRIQKKIPRNFFSIGYLLYPPSSIRNSPQKIPHTRIGID